MNLERRTLNLKKRSSEGQANQAIDEQGIDQMNGDVDDMVSHDRVAVEGIVQGKREKADETEVEGVLGGELPGQRPVAQITQGLHVRLIQHPPEVVVLKRGLKGTCIRQIADQTISAIRANGFVSMAGSNGDLTGFTALSFIWEAPGKLSILVSCKI